ncbi:MAG: acetoacetate decarboxylase family protein [Acidimicrobiia bacterium]
MGCVRKTLALAAGGAAVGYGLTRLVRSRTTDDNDGGFFGDATAKPERVDVGSAEIDLPILYHRTDCSFGVFSADAEATRALLPSDRLHPVLLRGGRAAVAVVSYNYIETGVGPYGEIGIAALCTLDTGAPPVVPLLRESGHPGFGAFVLHLPVTTRIARDAGRELWGYPKFVADMAFDFRPETHSVDLSEAGEDILSFSVQRRGRLLQDRKPLVTFSESDGALVRTEIALRSAYHVGLGGSFGRLELGDHPVAKELKDLDLSSEPVATKSYVSHAAILPRGEVIGATDRAYDGFQGASVESGRHTVRYADGIERVVTEASAGRSSTTG